MVKIKFFIFIFTLLLPFPASVFAIGGDGAACNPSTPTWGNCSISEISFQSSVTNTVNISSANLTTPYQASQPNTRYVLQGNITADSTAIEVNASYVIIDLNGYTITYNQVSPGEGVSVGDWNKGHIAVVNGSIIQGAAMSEGDQYGRGNSPVSTYNTADGALYSSDYMHVSNLYVRYGGRDMGGIVCTGDYGLYEQNTVEDTYQFGTLKNRHQGNDALSGSKNSGSIGGVYRNNTLVNVRHRGIQPGNSSESYGNHITIRSIATNSTGISQFDGSNLSIHDNTIIGRGEHPIGVGVGGDNVEAGNIVIYNNIMDMQTTALGEEYGASYLNDPLATYDSNAADGIRMSWTTNNVEAYNNQITVTTSSRYTGTYSPTGDTAYINGSGKGLFIGLYQPTSTAHFHNNTISVIGDGKYTHGVACSYSFSDKLFVTENIITSNRNNIVIGDDYGACNGFPMFRGNELVRYGSDSEYKSIANTYNDTDRNAQVRFVDTVYTGGASESLISLKPSDPGITAIYFGSEVDGVYSYYKQLHDNNGESSVLILSEYDPAITLAYANPGQTPVVAKYGRIATGSSRLSSGSAMMQ